MKVFATLESALSAARAQQERFSCGVLVLELRPFPHLPVAYFIIPHRDESLITEGIVHYPTPKGQPIMPKARKRRRRGAGTCPACGAASYGLCPSCKQRKVAALLAQEASLRGGSDR